MVQIHFLLSILSLAVISAVAAVDGSQSKLSSVTSQSNVKYIARTKVTSANKNDLVKLFANKIYSTEKLEFTTVLSTDDIYAGDRDIPFITSPNHIVLKGNKAQNESGSLTNGDITLFTQTSLDRLHQIPELVSRWQGSISVAVYIESPSQLEDIDQVFHKLKTSIKSAQRGAKAILGRSVIISLLFGVQFLDYELESSLSGTILQNQAEEVEMGLQSLPPPLKHHPYDLLYPINALRNLALKQCRTNLVFSLDADFVPSSGALARLTTVEAINLYSANSKAPNMLVVPAFEQLPPEDKGHQPDALPKPLTPNHLRSACSEGKIIPFHSKLKAVTPSLKPWCLGELDQPGKQLQLTKVQSATNFTAYFSLPPGNLYPLHLAKKGSLNTFFEPYIVGRKDSFPEFPERFRGYSFNKRAHSVECQRRGIKFYVEAGGPFVVHRPHAGSAVKSQWKGDEGGVKRVVGRAWVSFLKNRT